MQASQIEDLGARGAQRRSFQAQMTLKYCGGTARLGEMVFGWGKKNIEVGLLQKRTGIMYMGSPLSQSRSEKVAKRQGEPTAALHQLAQSDAQQDPTFQAR